MKKSLLAGLFFLGQLLAASAFADETIVMVRHGEKPAEGLGQLDCQGLNRALALPAVLLKKFDKPLAIFAPNPAVLKSDGKQLYNYIRPLATIEPTAILLGMPVNTIYGLQDIDRLQQALLIPPYKDGTIFVAWEHHLLEQFARKMLSTNGADPAVVPEWQSNDFDSIYILTVKSGSDNKRTVTFRRDAEGLDKQSMTCPTAAKP